MALCGKRAVADLDPHNLLVPRDFEGEWQENATGVG
ncbi:MAG: L-lactate dehydrogenase (cytochrome) [Limimaricola cinnabarinus]|jgi:L-lactate dehydrogenase (cytochrome)